jgi:hypothetical protein
MIDEDINGVVTIYENLSELMVAVMNARHGLTPIPIKSIPYYVI